MAQTEDSDLTSEPDGEERAPSKRRRRRWWRVPLLVVPATAFAIFVALGLWLATGKAMLMPDWVTERIEAELSDAFQIEPFSIADTHVALDGTFRPYVTLTDVKLLDQQGEELVLLNSLGAQLSIRSLVAGRPRAKSIAVDGGSIRIRRGGRGEFDLAFTGGVPISESNSYGDLINDIQAAFEVRELAWVRKIEGNDLRLSYKDERAGRSWQIEGGRIELTQDEAEIDVRVGFELERPGQGPAIASMLFQTQKGSTEARFGASIENIDASDIAVQSPALAWLGLVDAPISGSFRAEVDESGRLGELFGALEIGSGAIQPEEGTRPIRFDAGKAYFTYLPDGEQIEFTELSINTEVMAMTGEGKAYLRMQDNGWPEALLGQVRMREVALKGGAEGSGAALEKPVVFDQAIADFRLALDPFALRIGQLVVLDDETRAIARGEVTIGDTGWAMAVDATVDETDIATVMSLWPSEFAPGVRGWLTRNVSQGAVQDAKTGFRYNQGEPVKFSVGFDYSQATVRALRDVPAIEDAKGRATLRGETFTLVLDEGVVRAPSGGQLDVGSSVFSVADTNLKPAIATVDLKTTGAVGPLIELLANPPMNVALKDRFPDGIGTGLATLETRITVPLKPAVKRDEVDYAVTGAIRDFASTVLVSGKDLRLGEVLVDVTPDQAELTASGTVESLPVRGVWSRPLNDPSVTESTVKARLPLSNATLAVFGEPLPAGTLTGQSMAQIEISLPVDGVPRMQLESDLVGLGIQIPVLSWSKAPETSGSLTLAGPLDNTGALDRLTLTAPGLRATGRIDRLAAGLEARFDRVVAGTWLDAPVTLSPRGPGRAPALEISGGRVDLREKSGGGSLDAASMPVRAALDELVISNGIVLTGFNSELVADDALNGAFTARINGEVPVSGTLAPTASGTAIRISGDDAGALFKSAGLLDNVRGGVLDLVLAPLGPEGIYDGRLIVKGASIRNAPAMAELLSAISVVGLLEQLNGQGLVFQEFEANFRINPDRIIITQSSGVGPSLGLSLDGVYRQDSKSLDMQGVISPIYAINRVGRVFTRKGEGLFGFNFTMKGPARRPSVQVNPLSILTPGMFREIFRRPPPKPG